MFPFLRIQPTETLGDDVANWILEQVVGVDPHRGRDYLPKDNLVIRAWHSPAPDPNLRFRDQIVDYKPMPGSPLDWSLAKDRTFHNKVADVALFTIDDMQNQNEQARDEAWLQLKTNLSAQTEGAPIKALDVIEPFFRNTQCRVICFCIPIQVIAKANPAFPPFDAELLPTTFRKDEASGHYYVIMRNRRHVSVQSRKQFKTLFDDRYLREERGILHKIIGTGVAIVNKKDNKPSYGRNRGGDDPHTTDKLYKMIERMSEKDDDEKIYDTVRHEVIKTEKPVEDAQASVFDPESLKKRAANRAGQIMDAMPFLDSSVKENFDKMRAHKPHQHQQHRPSNVDSFGRTVRAPVAEKGFTPTTLVDVGCGEGSITKELGLALGLDEEHTKGCDVRFLPALDHFKYQRIEPSKPLPYENGSADLVTALMVLHHVEDQEEAIREMWRILADGGYLVIREHDCDNENFAMILDMMHGGYCIVWSNPKEDPTYLDTYFARYRDRGTWRKMIEAVGFKCVSRNSKTDTRASNHIKHYYDVFQKPKAGGTSNFAGLALFAAYQFPEEEPKSGAAEEKALEDPLQGEEEVRDGAKKRKGAPDGKEDTYYETEEPAATRRKLEPEDKMDE